MYGAISAMCCSCTCPDWFLCCKVNAEANEIEGVFVEGFPTLRLYPARKKHDPVEFTGERTVEEIEAWLNKECTNKLEEPVAAADSAAPTKHDTEL